jgi:hypothetical protein
LSRRPRSISIPNLFRSESRDFAVRLYTIAIVNLLHRERALDGLMALRKVKRFAAQVGVAQRHINWTWTWELEALHLLGRHQAAWRFVQRHLRTLGPRLADKPAKQRVRYMSFFVWAGEAPAAYFSHHDEAAAAAQEAYLDYMLDRADSYSLRNHIYNGDREPSNIARVTLWHIYRRLDRPLGSWPGWVRWVAGIHPKLFELTDMTAAELAHDAKRIVKFHRRLEAAEEGLRPAGVSYGLRDLLEPRRKVLARQRKHLRWKPPQDQAALRASFDEKRRHYFPWLAALGG